MVDKISDANRIAPEQQRRITSATVNALKPIMHFQVSMLRIWANSIERFANSYGSGLEKTASSAVEEKSDQERAA